jgi:thiamine-monophosphate kinase
MSSFNLVEKKLIELIKERSRTTDSIAGLGIGDDAAFLLLSSMDEGKLIVSTDSVVEDVHYKIGWCDYADVAIKLIERASSDLLAKGGHPHWALLNMNITKQFAGEATSYNAFIDAFCEKLKEHHIALIGGDITRSATNSFTMTVLGNTSTFIRRVNPEVESRDVVVMWGRVGASSFALDEFSSGCKPDGEIAALYRRPEACWQNDWLAGLHARVSMDQSDSVIETLETLSGENNLHLKINLDKIPLSMKVNHENQTKEEIVKNILKAAEDLAVFAIIPPAEINNVSRFQKITVIGEVIEKKTKEKQGLVSYYWQNEILQIDQNSENFYKHF